MRAMLARTIVRRPGLTVSNVALLESHSPAEGASARRDRHPIDSELAALNPAQRAAVTHGGAAGDGPLLVIAGAGSGKTRTLACRLAWLVATGADPQRILLVAFSRRAAADLERRAASTLRRMLGMPSARTKETARRGSRRGLRRC